MEQYSYSQECGSNPIPFAGKENNCRQQECGSGSSPYLYEVVKFIIDKDVDYQCCKYIGCQGIKRL